MTERILTPPQKVDCLWTMPELINLFGKPHKRFHGNDLNNEKVKHVTQDTRSLKEASLFFALQGNHCHGTSYLNMCEQQGAIAAVVPQTYEPNPKLRLPLFHTPSPLEALENMAHASRKRSVKTQRIGITGSSGKTTLTQGLIHLFSSENAFGSTRSYNNHLGVSLTLANMPPKVRYAFFEMGMNHAGELLKLGNLVEPHIGVITTVGDAHRAHFASLQDIALAKAELLATLSKPKIAILPRDNLFFPLLEKEACKHQCRIITFGRHDLSDVRCLHSMAKPQGQHLSVQLHNRNLMVTIPHHGEVFVQSTLAMLAVLNALDVKLKDFVDRFTTWQLPQGRGNIQQICWKQTTFHLIDESYNANPSSMQHALQRLNINFPNKKKILVLGDMKELGETSPFHHEKIADQVSQLSDTTCLAVGQDMIEGFKNQKKKHIFCQNWQEAWTKFQNILELDCIVLVKGSNAVELYKLVEKLLPNPLEPRKSL